MKDLTCDANSRLSAGPVRNANQTGMPPHQDLRRGDESQELVGTGRREWRGWEGLRRGLVEEAAVRGYIECRFGIRGEREGMCRRLDILYLTLHMWHLTFHNGLVRR